MELSVRPELTTAPVVRGLDTDHDRRRGQRCILLNRPVSLINRGKPVQINRATSLVDFPPRQNCYPLNRIQNSGALKEWTWFDAGQAFTACCRITGRVPLPYLRPSVSTLHFMWCFYHECDNAF